MKRHQLCSQRHGLNDTCPLPASHPHARLTMIGDRIGSTDPERLLAALGRWPGCASGWSAPRHAWSPTPGRPGCRGQPSARPGAGSAGKEPTTATAAAPSPPQQPSEPGRSPHSPAEGEKKPPAGCAGAQRLSAPPPARPPATPLTTPYQRHHPGGDPGTGWSGSGVTAELKHEGFPVLATGQGVAAAAGR